MLLNLTSPLAAAVTLKPDDAVGISFFAIMMAMIAASVFFFLETQRAKGKWKTSLIVAGLVTMVAAWHYSYMREMWADAYSKTGVGDSPVVFRYIDWLITVPLQMIEFYLILAAITKVSSGIFWRLMIGTLVMLLGGYLGESQEGAQWGYFAIGIAGWLFILYEIFGGEASKVCAASAPAGVQKAYSTLRLIVSVGWALYPIGYVVGAMADPLGSQEANLNLIYNIADVVNKIAFGAIIWSIATADHDE